MPQLTWVGKDKVKNHHHDVPFKLLNTQYTFTANEGTPSNSTNNKIIHGDNLEALKSLLPEFEAKVNCIYIDPPYNTGNEGWVYNDNVNDPRIKQWLGQVVGKEGEDLSRHDKWLCMMYPRLKLLHRLLADDGVIFISIDDNEQAHLKLVMDEIFGSGNFVASILWQKRTSPDARLMISDAHEFILCYSKNMQSATLNKLGFNEDQLKNFNNPDNDFRGVWASSDFTAQGFRPNQVYEITTPSGRKISPPPDRCWKNIEPVFLQLVNDNRIWFGKDGNGIPRRKTFLNESSGISAWTWWENKDVGHSQEAKQEVKFILSDFSVVFDTPKPVRLIERILQIATKPNSIILDSFAGSGTTAHAVLKQNAQDGGNRRFILIEMMDYAETITAERVRRVMNGYGEDKKAVAGLGGGFEFITVGEPLFLEDGNLNETIGETAIRQYIAHSERLDFDTSDQMQSVNPHCLGIKDGYLFVFNYQPQEITALSMDFLSNLMVKNLPKRPEGYVIYADKCTLTEVMMQQYNIKFKRIPRDITRF